MDAGRKVSVFAKLGNHYGKPLPDTDAPQPRNRRHRRFLSGAKWASQQMTSSLSWLIIPLMDCRLNASTCVVPESSCHLAP